MPDINAKRRERLPSRILMRIRKGDASEDMDAAIDQTLFPWLRPCTDGKRPGSRRYSTNSGAAFRALANYIDWYAPNYISLSSGPGNDCGLMSIGGDRATFEVTIEGGERPEWHAEGWARGSLALAICRALLHVRPDEPIADDDPDYTEDFV